MFTTALEPKRLELMRELVPNAAVIGMILDPRSPDTNLQIAEPPPLRVRLAGSKTFNASTDSEIDAGFAAVVARHLVRSRRVNPARKARGQQPCTAYETSGRDRRLLFLGRAPRCPTGVCLSRV